MAPSAKVWMAVLLGVLGPQAIPRAVRAQRMAQPFRLFQAEPPARVVPAAPPGTGRGVGPALLSLAVPGLGQQRLGQRRKWLYWIAEAGGWAAHFQQRSRGRRFRTDYRNLAWSVARLRTGPRVDGDFAYYETMSKWVRSGAYDADPDAAGLQPESDQSTYNGSVWALARGIFLPPQRPAGEGDASYAAALDYYREHAYGVAFLWDWSSHPDDKDRYSGLIKKSDDHFRTATNLLGAIAANHVLSAVDAYLSTRLPVSTHTRFVASRMATGRARMGLLLRIDGLP